MIMVNTMELDLSCISQYKNCVKGDSCGNTCIARGENCKPKPNAKANAVADLLANPDNLAEGAKSSESSGGIETAKDAIAKGEQFLKSELDELDKLNSDAKVLRAEYRKAAKEDKGEIKAKLAEAEKAVDKHFDKIYEKVVSGDREKGEELAKELSFTKPVKAYADGLREMASDFYTMSGGKGAESLEVFTINTDRAYAVRPILRQDGTTHIGGIINIGTSPENKTVVFHEMAHHIEFENPKYGEAAKDFVLSRATGEEKPMKDLTGNPKYADDEKAFPDKFIDPYVGKLYGDGSTEVLSMGVQQMTNRTKAKYFMENDREHFLFTVGVLKD